MFSDVINVRGDVHIEIYDTESGKLKQEFDFPNLVVSAGKVFIASRIANTSLAITHMGIGTGIITPVTGDVALSVQLLTRATATTSYTTGDNFVSISASFPGSTYANASITEAGLFTASTGNKLVCRTTFGSFPILSTDTIAINWKISIL